MKMLLVLIVATGSISAFSQSKNKCSESVILLGQTSELINIYKNKVSISPEMEENVRNILIKLNKQHDTELDLVSKNCSNLDLSCKKATEELVLTSRLLSEYEKKESISPEMEENIRNIIVKLKEQKSVAMEKFTEECNKDHSKKSSVVDSGREVSNDKKSPGAKSKEIKSYETTAQ